ncbi:MAG: FAD:protein FMN transferase [Clostridia bacterium]
MKKKLTVLILLIIFIVGLVPSVAFASVDFSEQAASFYETYFSDIPLQVVVWDSFGNASRQEEFNSASREIDTLMNNVDRLASASVVGSDIYRFNHAPVNTPVEISSLVKQMYDIASKMYKVTGGAYNSAVYRLVDLWGFSSRTYLNDGNEAYDRDWTRDSATNKFFYPLPDDKYISAFKQLTDFSKVVLTESDGKYFLTNTCPVVNVDGIEYTMTIDLGGIAKGYAVDEVENILAKYTFNKGYISLGGSSLRVLSNSKGEALELSLINPRGYGNYAKFNSVKNANVSTSGDYVRNYFVDDTRYCHIVDGATGRPVATHLMTVTVVGDISAAEADCLTTGMMVMGLERNKALISDKEGYVQKNNLLIAMSIELSSTSKYGIVTNAPGDSFAILDKGYAIYNGVEESMETDKTGIIVLFTILGLVVVGGLVAVIVIKTKRRGADKLLVVGQVRKGKPFLFKDIFVYVALAVLIVGLFAVFVFPKGAALKKIEVYEMASSSKLMFSYSFVTNDYSIAIGYEKRIKITESKDKLLVTVYERDIDDTTDLTKVGYNIIEISIVKDNLYAKVIEADCSKMPDCVNNFFPIKAGNDSIICIPHGIKVIGVGEKSNNGGLEI